MIQLKNACQQMLNDITINVVRVQKNPTTGQIQGLNVLQDQIIEQNYCGIFEEETNEMLQAKVMKMIYDLKQQGVQFQDCMKYFARIVDQMYQNNQLFVTGCIDSVKQAMTDLGKIAQDVNNISRNISAISIARTVQEELQKDKIVNQQGEIIAYASHGKIDHSKWVSVTNTNENIRFIKSVQLTYDGHWYSLQQNTQQNPVESIKYTGIMCKKGGIGLFSRTSVLCSRQDQQLVGQACDELKEIHQKRLQLALQSETYGQLAKQAKELHQNVTKQEYSLNFQDFDEIDQPSLGGSVVHGSVMLNQLQNNEKQLLINQMQQDQKITQNVIINIRTTAKITFEKLNCSIIVTMSDAVNRKNGIITTPELTSQSPYQILRDYYTIYTVKSSQQDQQQKQQVKQQQSDNESEDDSYSDDEDEEQLSKADQYKLKQKIYQENLKKLDDLKQKLEENMQMRKDSLELICDQNQEGFIQHAFTTVEELPPKLDFTDFVISDGDNVDFFQICGIPVPFLPQYIQNCTITETAPYLLKIKFIAPGQISGKKEMHKQIQYYGNEKTFLKELCFETNNPNVAKRVRDKILAYKKQGEQNVAQEVQKNKIIRSVDPWNQYADDPALKEFYQKQTENIDYTSVITIDSNQMADLIQMRPKYRLKGQTTSKTDYTSLKATKNSLIYRYSFSQQKIDVIMPYKDIRNIYYDKFTDKNHVTTIVIEFFQPKSVNKLIPNKETQNNLVQTDNALAQQSTYYFTLYISKETEAKLGYAADREDYNSEKRIKLQMKECNKIIKKFLAQVRQLAPLINITQQNNQLKFQGSIENSGLSQISSYSPSIIGLFNKKTSESVNLRDVQFVLFENVNYSSQTSIIASFVYKDVRVMPWQVKQINFDYIQDIPFYEYGYSYNWKQFIENLNQNRQSFIEFVESGGWKSLFSNEEDSSSEEDNQTSDYTADDDESEYDDDDDSYDSDSDVKSETDNNESEDTGDVYDWSQEDSD